MSQDLPVVFPLRFPPSITLRAPSVTLLAFRYPLAFQIETGDEVRTNNKLNAVADPGEGAGGARGARASALFLDQTEARREDPPPPLTYVMVWIRHCNAICCVSVVSLLCYD